MSPHDARGPTEIAVEKQRLAHTHDEDWITTAVILFFFLIFNFYFWFCFIFAAARHTELGDLGDFFPLFFLCFGHGGNNSSLFRGADIVSRPRPVFVITTGEAAWFLSGEGGLLQCHFTPLFWSSADGRCCKYFEILLCFPTFFSPLNSGCGLPLPSPSPSKPTTPLFAPTGVPLTKVRHPHRGVYSCSRFPPLPKKKKKKKPTRATGM